MKNVLITILLSVFLFLAIFAFAEKEGAVSGKQLRTILTEADIKAAIDNGVKNKKRHFGLRLEDQNVNFWNAMANSGKPAWAQDEAKGFSMEAFTPISWISECAAQATRQYLPFALENVDEEMKAPILYLIVHGKHSKRMGNAGGSNGGAMSGESVAHVVLRSENKELVVQPTKEESFDEGQQNVFGARSEFAGMKVEFPLEEVAKLRSTSSDGEFFVTVVGENSEKDFKIKKKHFEKLP
jgi:hypothetical protein